MKEKQQTCWNSDLEAILKENFAIIKLWCDTDICWFVIYVTFMSVDSTCVKMTVKIKYPNHERNTEHKQDICP